MKQFVVALFFLAVLALCSGETETTKDVDSDTIVEKGHVIKERAAQFGIPFGGSGSSSQSSSVSESGSIGAGFGPLNLGVSASKSASQSQSGSGSFGFLG